MNFTENFRLALRALSANKMRSGLTMLGIIIGVGSVVALMAIGTGATAGITSQVQGIGSNVLAVIPGRLQGGPGSGNSTQQAYMFYADYELLAANLTKINTIVPAFQSSLTVTREKETVTVNITGTSAQYAEANSYKLAVGRFITQGDRDTTARVAVLGSQTAIDLFGPLNPLDRPIKINGVTFRVVGVFASKGSSGFGNADQILIVPLETGYQKLFGTAATHNGKLRVSSIAISVKDADEVTDVTLQIERLMRRAHRLGLGDDLDFSVLSQATLLSTLGAITTILTTFLGAIAGISLLVGGIGVMNIMLVSVTERTREIGLRKALGARRNVILMQFLVETLVLSLVGGMIGIGFGVGTAAAVTATGLVTAQVTASSIALAFGFSMAVGIFFGLYPAFRASRLRPIEALRYE